MFHCLIAMFHSIEEEKGDLHNDTEIIYTHNKIVITQQMMTILFSELIGQDA